MGSPAVNQEIKYTYKNYLDYFYNFKEHYDEKYAKKILLHLIKTGKSPPGFTILGVCFKLLA